MEQMLSACIIGATMLVTGSIAVTRMSEVHVHKDSITQCEYLYTAGGELTPREDGFGNHYGCYTGGE